MSFNRFANTIWARGMRGLVQSPVCMSAVVVLITLFTLIRVLSADFVMWDDDVSIYNNPNLKGLSIEGLRWIFSDVDTTRRYVPLSLLSWSITYHFWGLNPFWYHLGNWLLHGLSTAVLFLIVRYLLLHTSISRGERASNCWWINLSAVLAALLWSLHPLRVEPVAWATGRMHCLATFFLLLSTLSYLRANLTPLLPAKQKAMIAVSVAFYFASLLSHPIGVGFIVALVVLDIYPLRRLGGSSGWWRTAANRRAIFEKLPFVAAALAVAGVTLAIRLASAGAWEKAPSLAEFGLLERLMQSLYIWAYFAWRPWYPIDLSPVYTTFVSFAPFSWPFIASGLAVVSGTIVLVILRHRWPLALALGISHLALLVPVLGLFEHPHYHSDRYSLIPSICWSILVAAILANVKGGRSFRVIALPLVTTVVIALGLLSYQQTLIWHNSVTLFKYMIDKLGDNPYRGSIQWRLGSFLAEQGETEGAIGHLQEAIRIIPPIPNAYSYLGFVFQSQGKLDEAILEYQEALRLDPGHLISANNLGLIYYKQEKLDEAIRIYETALRLNPDALKTRFHLALAYAKQGRYEEANYNLGLVNERLGGMDETRRQNQQSLQIKPDLDPAAWKDLESLLQ